MNLDSQTLDDTLPDSVHARRLFPKPIDTSIALEDAFARGMAEGRRVEREAQAKSDVRAALMIGVVATVGVWCSPTVLLLRMYGLIGK